MAEPKREVIYNDMKRPPVRIIEDESRLPAIQSVADQMGIHVKVLAEAGKYFVSNTGIGSIVEKGHVAILVGFAKTEAGDLADFWANVEKKQSEAKTEE